MLTEETAAAYTRTDAKKDYNKWSVANTAYHNGVSIMSDTEFDRLTKKLKPFYPDIDKRVGAAPKAKHASARKVRLPIPMNSLDKAYGKDLPRVIKAKIGTASQAVISNKVDGASLQYERTKEDKYGLYTRGKDGVGQDVSHLIPMLNKHGILGSLAKGETVRLELVVPKGKSSGYDDDDLKKRNAVSGLINSRTVDDKLLAKCKAIALAYMKPSMAPSRAFKKLITAGWIVPKFKIVKPSDLTDAFLSAYFKERKASAKYDMDGLVILADVAEEPKLTNPKRGFAFKINEAGPTAEIVKIEWQVSRYRQMKPVAIIKPVTLDGVKVTRATLHNAKYVKDNRLGPGATIEIIRSGGVIPYVVQVISKAAKPAFPPASTYEWDETKVNILSIDDKHDLTVSARVVQNFFAKIGVLGFGPAVAELVADKSIHEICAMDEADWLRNGGGKSVSSKMPSTIANALKNTTMPKLMAASGVFGQGFGESSGADLWSVMQSKKITKASELRTELASLAGWSDKSAKDVAGRWQAWAKWCNSLPFKPVKKAAPKINKNGHLKGKIVVFTGVRDATLSDDIIKAGGTIGSGVSGKTSYLIYKDGFEGLKTQKAKDLGVKPIPYSEARAKLKL